MTSAQSDMQVTRDNLPEAIDEALALVRQADEAFRTNPGPYLTGQYIRIAISTLETIKAQLMIPTSERMPRPTQFGPAFVRDDPEINQSLASLIMKIEDVYRRWHDEIHARQQCVMPRSERA